MPRKPRRKPTPGCAEKIKTNHDLPQRIPGIMYRGDERPVELRPPDLIWRVIDGLKEVSTGAIGVVCLSIEGDWDEEMLWEAADKYGVTLAAVIRYTIGGSMS
ncbi:hypothetical protein ACIBJI_23895 [Nocardia sp. NPDC050408]|uniref:hypothetical protein n=1 Tax=Nocardia sp. NPDC050408 TaxID=3364319 RepID=UPI0037B993DD